MAIATWDRGSILEAVASGSAADAEAHGGSARSALRERLGRKLPARVAALPRGVRFALCMLIAGGGVTALASGGGSGAALSGGIVLLALGMTAFGWSIGLHARSELQRDIDDRSHELWHALSELELAQAETVRRLSMAVELRDEDTGAHIERIGRLSALLAEQAGMEPAFCARLSHAAPLHDVGKVAIPDSVLLKPGPLSAEERAVVETHAEEGHRLLNRSSSSILEMGAKIALSHHERWDGSGYPRGLAREQIPIEGRIVAVTDVFDALTSDRVYRRAYSVEEAAGMMREQRGAQFDPYLLDIFLEAIGAPANTDRLHIRSNPKALAAGLLEVLTKALEQGDAVMAEGAMAQANDDGFTLAALHGHLMAPAMRRIAVMREAGDIDAETEQRAGTIVRRLLAMLYRSMIEGSEQNRERVLLAAVEGDHQTIELQMAHDQLAAAGYRATFVGDFSPERLSATIRNQAPAVIVLGASRAALAPALQRLMISLADDFKALPVLLGGAAADCATGSQQILRMAEPASECVPLVEALLGDRGGVAVQIPAGGLAQAA